MSGWALPNRVRMTRAQQRRRELDRLLREGECIKRAAYRVGISHRTARRYLAETR